MRRWVGLPLLALALACSDLDEGEAGVVSLEITAPVSQSLEVGEQRQLVALPLDADGEVVEVPVTWVSDDPAVLAVDQQSGLLTGVSAGGGGVQATVGSLASDLLAFSVLAPADTLIIVGDSVVPVPVDPGATGPLVVRLESFRPPSVLGDRPVTYQVTSPAPGDIPVVALTGGVQSLTVATGSDGTVSGVTLARTPGTIALDTAIVEVRATRAGGSQVPGSGQRFIVLFQ